MAAWKAYVDWQSRQPDEADLERAELDDIARTQDDASGRAGY